MINSIKASLGSLSKVIQEHKSEALFTALEAITLVGFTVLLSTEHLSSVEMLEAGADAVGVIVIAAIAALFLKNYQASQDKTKDAIQGSTNDEETGVLPALTSYSDEDQFENTAMSLTIEDRKILEEFREESESPEPMLTAGAAELEINNILTTQPIAPKFSATFLMAEQACEEAKKSGVNNAIDDLERLRQEAYTRIYNEVVLMVGAKPTAKSNTEQA